MIKSQNLKEKARDLQVTLQIGKSGITDGTIKEIMRQLKAKELIKIKFLSNYVYGKDKNEIVNEIVKKTSSQLILKRGFTITIYKKRMNQKDLVIDKDKKKIKTLKT